jgi:signal transduction histidine kinase
MMPIRVLILDDRPQDRFLAKRALAAEFPDLVLTEVLDAAEFEAALQQPDADVIITDYQLNWTDGLQVLEAVRARGLDAPVVMFTQTGTEEVAAAGLRAGLADYIIKTPTHYGRLAHAVRIALQNAATARNEREARARERDALRTAEDALRLKDEFLATLSHELRTPLNAISGWLQIIQSQPDADRLRRGLTAIERNTALLTRLIADLVDVSRIVTGTLTLQIQPTDVRKVVEAALDSVRPAVQAKRLNVEVTGSSRLEPVAADPDRLQQVVWNLLSNAVKFTPPDGRITVSLQRTDSMVELSIADNGCGIRAEFLPRVFDRFSQQDAGLTREHGGMGLGLAIVRYLTEMHGGSVSVSSIEGQGTTFTVRIPVVATVPARPARAIMKEQRSRLRGIHVLVIDDDADAREVVEKMLEDEGAVVASATSAADGYEILTRTRPDVLICDIGMPTEDGLSFIARLRRDPDASIGATPALAVTAYAGERDREQSLQAGFQSHLPKPFTAAELAGVVDHLAHFHKTPYQRPSGV